MASPDEGRDLRSLRLKGLSRTTGARETLQAPVWPSAVMPQPQDSTTSPQLATASSSAEVSWMEAGGLSTSDWMACLSKRPSPGAAERARLAPLCLCHHGSHDSA